VLRGEERRGLAIPGTRWQRCRARPRAAGRRDLRELPRMEYGPCGNPLKQIMAAVGPPARDENGCLGGPGDVVYGLVRLSSP
jgi:hypothetical protein